MLFVAGCARSGTTFTMSALHACGAKLGTVDALNEIPALKSDVIRPYLQQVAGDPFGQWRLPSKRDLVDIPDFRERVEKVAGDAEVIKLVGGLLFWPLWVKHFPEAKWLLLYRDPKRIAESCMRAKFLQAYSTEAEWESWARQYHRRAALVSQQVEHRWVTPGDTIKGDMAQLKEAVLWLGYDFKSKAVREAIKPERWGG